MVLYGASEDAEEYFIGTGAWEIDRYPYIGIEIGIRESAMGFGYDT